ncbi:excitatory amino acid transporter 1 [Nothobranchius furzeri]|uniref:excitatory amino acid transporter 1 n=1 Tax=Nothobranchius furzeri TaxID=105023 RepID=UPI0039047763
MKRSKIWDFTKKHAFVILTMIGVGIGLGLGFVLRHLNMSPREIQYLTFPGELLLRILQMLVLPLIISSLISGMANTDPRAYGKIGFRAFAYYMVTTVVAVFTGIVVAVLIQPGKSSKHTLETSSGEAEPLKSLDAFLDLIRNMLPLNLVEACFRKVRSYITVYSSNDSSGIKLNASADIPMPGTADGINVLGLLVYSIAFGLILSSMGPQGEPLKDFFDCLNKAVMRLVSIVIWYSPVGIIFLLAGQVVKMANTLDIGREIAMYVLCVITGMAVHSFLTLPLIYFIVTRKNPIRFFRGILQALVTAFGTSSSSATLPVTVYCMEKNHNMDRRVTRLMLPIGATVNMDGSALYEAIAAFFIAQRHNIDLSAGQIIVLSCVATAASIGAAGIPSAGLVTVVIVLSAVGLPTEDISLVLIFDWFLDRLRTVANVLGDCIGVGVVQHLSRHELETSSPAEKDLVVEMAHPF